MTVAPPVATLGGVPLAGQAVYEWPLTAGVIAHEARFEVTEKAWEQLKPYSGISEESPGLIYLVTVGGKEVQRVERLFILDAYPGSSEFTRRIRVVDRRWLWGRKHVATSYNVRRPTGDTTVVSDGQNAETPQVLPRVQWLKPTLREETTAWTATEVLEDVFKQVDGIAPIIPPGSQFEGLPVDDLVLDDPGPAAVERVLAYFPGAAVYLNHAGRAVVKDTTNGDELEIFNRLKDVQQVTRGVRVTERKWSRPSRVDVLITPEFDVRFDYAEVTTGTTTNSEDANKLYNVAQVTEPAGLTLADGTIVGPGSWIDLTDLFEAWGVGPGFRPSGGAPRQMSFDILRAHRMSDYRFLAPEFIYRGRDPDGQWVRRYNAVAASYRKYFRIARDFMARLETVRPVRAAVVNSALGARAASPVYSDYTIRPSYKGVFTTDPQAPQGVAQRGYKAKLTDPDLQPAPARVVPVDAPAGVFAFLPQKTDSKGYYSDLVLGYPDTGSNLLGNPALHMPVQSLGALGAAANIITESFSIAWDFVDLEAAWNASTVMSCISNTPNSTDRLYKVTVSAGEVGESEALGPPITVRVYPGVITARFAWLDSEADVIVGRIRGDSLGWPSQLVNAKHVQDVARAAALRVYEQYKDRPFGTMQVDSTVAGPVEPGGMISSVSQRMAGGATVTQIQFGTVSSPVDIWRYLSGSTRRALLRSQLSIADPLQSAMGLF